MDKPEDFIADRKRPFTGAEYVASLRDGRAVYIDGERVADVTTVARPDTMLVWYRKLVARKFDGSKARRGPGRPRTVRRGCVANARRSAFRSVSD